MSYYDWINSENTCEKCGWRGLGKEFELRESFGDGAEYECPKCGQYAGFIAFPTFEEVADDPRADPIDKEAAAYSAARTAAFENTKLVSPDQLPELDPMPESLTWDVTDLPILRSDVVISFGDREIWREMSWYENYHRFGEIASILYKKYGPSLKDLVPTGRSQHDLYGDSLGSWNYVERVRASLSRGVDPSLVS